MKDCYPCKYPNPRWDYHALKLLKDMQKLCEVHSRKADDVIAAGPGKDNEAPTKNATDSIPGAIKKYFLKPDTGLAAANDK